MIIGKDNFKKGKSTMTEENLTPETVSAEIAQAPDILDAPIGLIPETATIAASSDPVANAVENITIKPTIEANNTASDPVEAPEPIQLIQPSHSQEEANRIAIVASASYHLTHLHKIRMAVSETVAKIMQNTVRATNWTLEETEEIWDRVESELKTAL